MADEVFTTGNVNVQAFTAATQHAKSRGDAAEAERAATETARLALPAQAQAAVAPAILATSQAGDAARTAAVTLPKFRSTTTANPAAPTQAELDANPNGIGGLKLTAAGGVQQLKWAPHTTAGAWVDVGKPSPTADQVVEAQTRADTAKAAADTAQATMSNMTRAELQAWGRGAAVMAFADGSPWAWMTVAAATAIGKTANSGTVLPAQDGGVWVRLYSGPIKAEWFGIPTDGASDAQPAVRLIVDALKEGDAVDFGNRVYIITTPDQFVLNKKRVDLIGQGVIFRIAGAARRDHWTALFLLTADDVRMNGVTIECQVPDAADETLAPTGANGYIQRGVYVGVAAKRVGLTAVMVTAPYLEGIRAAEGSTGSMSACDVTHRAAYKDAGRTQITASRTCISITSPGYSGADAYPGTNGFIPTMDRTKALPATTGDWQLSGCKVRGGTHGYGLFNVKNVTLSNCEADDNSHRNVGVGPTCDNVHVLGGRYTNAGSTNIHFANGCDGWSVQGATLDATLLSSLDGTGVNAYVGCKNGFIGGNFIRNAYWNAVHIGFGCESVTIANNPELGVAESRRATPGTHAIAIASRLFKQAEGYASAGFAVTKSATRGVTVTGNNLTGAYALIGVYHEANTVLAGAQPNSNATLDVTDIVLSNNTGANASYGFSAHDLRYGGGASSSGYVRELTLTDFKLRFVSNTAYNVSIPAAVYFSEIRGVAHWGEGFGAPSKLITRANGQTHWSAAGAPTESGVYANGNTYLNETTGELYLRQGGAWLKVTAA